MDSNLKTIKKDNNMLNEKLSRIKLLLTDCDGVLTDSGVYYGEAGEVLKKFNR